MRAKKRLGQHFLEPAWADRLVAAIEPRPGDRFVEIGPGPGALTLRLAPRVAHLTAVEVDPELVRALAPRLPANVGLVQQDFLTFDLHAAAGGGPVRVAGNLPYNLTSPILFRLIDAARHGVALQDATVMVQAEVADRIEAGPGGRDYGVLSILVQLRAGVRRLLTLPPGAFRPAPEVHSAVLRLDFHPPPAALADEALLEGMVRSMFTQRRKTLANALRPFADSRGTTAPAALARAGIDPARRAETLSQDEVIALANAFEDTTND
jgi:16S rRNA (adenine1518-N6/adenine1519-N6)-dimethyltransferase